MNAREDVNIALEHLKRLAPTAADDTLEKVIATVRSAMGRYGDATCRPAVAGIDYRPCDADGVPCEWIIPEGAIEDERIVHVHGGSLIAGSPASHRAMLSLLAQKARRPVLSVDYRLAPEHTYPSAHDDSRKAFDWAVRRGPDGKSAARRIALAGDSSGATLALSTCAGILLDGGRSPDCLALIGPVMFWRPVEGRQDRESDPLINEAALQAIALYAADAPVETPAVSPLNYGDAVLGRLPPTLIQVGAPEFLLYDSLALAKRLASLNRQVVLSAWQDMPHVWHHFTTHLSESGMALAEIGDFIDRVFGAAET